MRALLTIFLFVWGAFLMTKFVLSIQIKLILLRNQHEYGHKASGDVFAGVSSVEMKYDATNRLISYNGEEVKYDADGNMIYGPLDGKMTKFEYDSRNRLICAGDVRYRYDAENVRIAADYPEYTEEYVIDRENAPSRTLQIIRTDKNSGADNSETNSGTDKEAGIGYSDSEINYYYGIALIYEKEADKISVYHFDHLGSTRNITDEKGNICYRFRYGTFGELLSVWDGDNTSLTEINKDHPVRFLYNGALGVVTDNNELLYMRQRYYNTDIKRFINQDILSGSATLSQSLNRYAYVQGNPINYNDPFGLSPRQILQPYVNLAHDLLGMAAMIPGPVGIIAGFSDIALSLATGDFSSASKAFVNMLVMRGCGGLINNMCKLPKPVKYLVGSALFGFGAYNVTKAYTMIKQSALNLVDLIYNGGSVFDYIHEISTGVQGVGLLSGGVKLSVGSAVGMRRQCFVAGTKVKTEDGDKNIEDIEEGDIVWAYDPVTGETGLKEVKQTFENETETLVHVTVSNENDKETIDTTVRHPFYVVGYGFKYASELRIGDKVISVSGDIYEVTSLEIENLDTPVKVYNFEVEDWHTYFVSASGILVHNLCDTDGAGTTNASTDKKQDSQSTTTSTKPVEGTGGSYNIPTEQQLYDAISEWTKMEESLANSNTQVNKFNTATVAYDVTTGQYYYGMNRGVQISGDSLNPLLESWLPESSLNQYRLGNCAEVDAVNQALNSGADVSNLYLYTINTKKKFT